MGADGPLTDCFPQSSAAVTMRKPGDEWALMSLETPSVVSALLSLIVLCLQSTCYLPILLHSRQQTQRLAGFAPSPHTEKKGVLEDTMTIMGAILIQI